MIALIWIGRDAVTMYGVAQTSGQRISLKTRGFPLGTHLGTSGREFGTSGREIWGRDDVFSPHKSHIF